MPVSGRRAAITFCLPYRVTLKVDCDFARSENGHTPKRHQEASSRHGTWRQSDFWFASAKSTQIRGLLDLHKDI
jgi:hypothetical protein